MRTHYRFNEELESKRVKAKELIAAGGCYALAWWSWTDAVRLCPAEHNKIEPPEMPYDSEWIVQARHAVELIQRGIELFEKIERRGSSDEWKTG